MVHQDILVVEVLVDILETLQFLEVLVVVEVQV
jgi:hypothetical protein